MNGYITILGFIDGLRPEPRLSVSEWADRHRVLDSKAAAEPGPYRTSRTPFWKEPMDALSAFDPTRKVVVQKGVQVGATELGLNWIGSIIDNTPGPILLVQPTDEMVQRNSKMRIAPMIEASPRLRAKVKPSRSKDSGNTVRQKEFAGGVLVLTGANSAVGLRSMPVRFLMLDETDGYPGDVDGEGNPVGLAEKRTSTFANRKILLISTPTVEGQSIIANEFALTDQRYYYVPCPECGCEQILEFQNLRWEKGKYDNVTYECSHCGEQIKEYLKGQMLAAGRWVPTAPENSSPYLVGYHLSALYSPPGWKLWTEIAQEWDNAQGDENKLKIFFNTVLGETYKEKTDAPQWETIHQRAEDYPVNKVFSDISILTCGADVQGDRIELEVVGWKKGKISQHIDYRVLLGDTTKPEVWFELDKILNEVFVREDGATLPIRLLAIDSGYNSATVYSWAKRHGYSRVIPIKGVEGLDNYFSPPKNITIAKHGQKIGKAKVWAIGVSFIKTELYGFLRQSINPETNLVPDGYCYFPRRDVHFFKSLTSEAVQLIRTPRGFLKYQWIKTYERNEVLDCRVYARAAAAILGIDRWTESRWLQESQFTITIKHETIPEKPKPKAKQESKTKPRSSFWNR